MREVPEVAELLPDALVRALERAAAEPSVDEVVEAVAAILARAVDQGTVVLPADMRRPSADRIVRHLLHENPTTGLAVEAAVWGPEQSEPLHEHPGDWCVEVVLSGEMAVSRFEIVQQSGDRYRFRPIGRQTAQADGASCLVPPLEPHTLTNRSVQRSGGPDGADGVAIVLQVSDRLIDHLHVYRPVGGGWFEQERRELLHG